MKKAKCILIVSLWIGIAFVNMTTLFAQRPVHPRKLVQFTDTGFVLMDEYALQDKYRVIGTPLLETTDKLIKIAFRVVLTRHEDEYAGSPAVSMILKRTPSNDKRDEGFKRWMIFFRSDTLDAYSSMSGPVSAVGSDQVITTFEKQLNLLQGRMIMRSLINGSPVCIATVDDQLEPMDTYSVGLEIVGRQELEAFYKILEKEFGIDSMD